MNLIKENVYHRNNKYDLFHCFHSYISLDKEPFYRFFGEEQLETKISLNNNLFFHGEDPRPFILDKKSYVLSQRFIDTFDNIENYIVNTETGESKLYLVNRDNFSYGKNWTPFVYNNELYIIQKFDPLTIIKNGNIIMELNTNLPVFNNFSQYRGGTNGIEFDNNKVIGFGHKTIKLDHHIPFIWILDFNKNVFEIMDLSDFQYKEKLNDPTSLWHDETSNKYYLSIFASSDLWSYYPIYGRSLIYEININECIKNSIKCESYKSYNFNFN
jgi:hypothetical protein